MARGGFPGGGNMNSMMKKVQKMQQEMARTQQEIEEKESKGIIILILLIFIGLNAIAFVVIRKNLQEVKDMKDEMMFLGGLKDNEKNNKSCFVTYGDEELSDNGWSYYLKSVVVFGKIEILEDQELAAKKLRELASRYYPSLLEVDSAMERSFKNVLVYYLDIEHMTCKKVHEK